MEAQSKSVMLKDLMGALKHEVLQGCVTNATRKNYRVAVERLAQCLQANEMIPTTREGFMSILERHPQLSAKTRDVYGLLLFRLLKIAEGTGDASLFVRQVSPHAPPRKPRGSSGAVSGTKHRAGTTNHTRIGSGIAGPQFGRTMEWSFPATHGTVYLKCPHRLTHDEMDLCVRYLASCVSEE